MDPLTHAASGAVAMLAFKDRPKTFWALPIAAIACASPDIDLAFIHTPFQFLLLHRGITHSLACAPVLGFLLALLAWPLWRSPTPNKWKFRSVWLLCVGMVLLHVWLDIFTTYGTMIFLPFSHYRVRLNSLYIIDPFILLPLLWALWRWRAKRRLIALTMAWILLYPLAGVGINSWHTVQCERYFADHGREVGRINVLPDAFAPFFWRVIFLEESLDGMSVREMGLNALGEPRGRANLYPAAFPPLVRNLRQISVECDTYFQFAMLPVMVELRQEDRPEDLNPDEYGNIYMFYDLRFGSCIEFVSKLLAMRPNADIPFQLMVELVPPTAGDHALVPSPIALAAMDVRRIRLRFTDSGRDSHWHKPQPPTKPPFLDWLVGLR